MVAFANYLAFQIGWFACVVGGANNWPWLGTVLTGLFILVHLWQIPHPKSELTLILLAGLLGALLDSALAVSGLLQFPSGILVAGMAPHWIIAMWMLFAATLNSSLRWLKGHWLLATLLGMGAGPAAYYAGSKLGGVTFHNPPTLSLLAIALAWSIAMPILIALSIRFDGREGTNQQNGPHSMSATAGKPA